MRQIVLRTPGEFIERHIDPPGAAPGEALVRIHRVGICGSDFHAFNGVHPAYSFPRVIGHELGCEVLEIPGNDKSIRPGDHCSIEPYINCDACGPCRMNRPNCCEQLRLFGIHLDGGMQAFLSVPLRLLHKSATLSLDQLALMETLGIGAHAVARAGLRPGEDAMVIGAGPIGLAVVQFALAAGARVRVVEKSEHRRSFARRFVDDVVPDPGETLASAVFDATGSAVAMADSLRLVAPGGRLIFVGLTRDPVSIDDALLHKREVTVYASRNSCHQFPRMIAMVERGEIDTGPWINARLPLAEVPREFAALRRRPDLVKAMVEVGDEDA
jgi:2-desacetyl-2-hydroxyethyl bacteriochlorophyllide A dehydrogenase